ncbi:NAD-dependent epimerase/dehydratase family protein [Methanoregula sp.]|uniref:NAD-dependent epimerase/dehydratase family protein n=1 Tax=Methanoregula sp. TaxID=2052170 RepID=UPI003562230E
MTGSSGTIGTRLCEKLLACGYNVIGVDKRSNPWNSKIDKITIIADLCDKNSLRSLPKDIDMIIHLAANARVYNLVVDPALARDNFEMLFNVLEFGRVNNIKKIIFSSSREVYGNSGLPIYSEEDAFVKYCESPYTASKIGGEALIHAYHQCYGIDFIITRFSNVYGMYDESDRVIPLFIRQTLNNEDLTIFGKDKVLDFTYIDDTVDGIIKCIEHFSQEKNSVFNIASGTSIPIIEVAEQIIQGMNGNNSIVLNDNRTGEVVRSSIDISKAQQKLGYLPKIKIHEGIKKSIDWYTKHLYTK